MEYHDFGYHKDYTECIVVQGSARGSSEEQV
jgi:hypothetical protein